MKRGLKIRTRLLIGALVLVCLIAVQLLVVLPKQFDKLGLKAAQDRAAAVSALTVGAVLPGLVFEDDVALASALRPLSQAPDVQYALVFNLDGVVVAQHPPGAEKPTERLKAAAAGTPTFLISDDRLHVAQSIKGLDDPIGTLQIGLSLEALKRAQKANERNAAEITLLLAGGILAGILLIGFALTRPILLLTRTADDVARGKLEHIEISTRKGVSDSADELERLTHSFFVMLGRLRSSQREIQAQVTLANEERARAEAALAHLEQTQDQLIKSEKLASLGQLIAGIAHEINTPLGAITASSEFIETRLADSFRDNAGLFHALDPDGQKHVFDLLDMSNKGVRAQGREGRRLRRDLTGTLEERGQEQPRETADTMIELGYFGEDPLWTSILARSDMQSVLSIAAALAPLMRNTSNVSIAAVKAKRIVMALKTFSRTSDEKISEPINIGQSIQTVLTLYENQMKHGMVVEANLPQDMIIYGNGDEISQVWTNLVQNSIQAMKGHGRLWIDAKESMDEIKVSVSNDGPVIPEDIKSRIFEAFFTTKPAGEGTGLGLDIVHRIVTNHNGQIWVESNEEQTIFSVILAKGEPGPNETSPMESSAKPG